MLVCNSAELEEEMVRDSDDGDFGDVTTMTIYDLIFVIPRRVYKRGHFVVRWYNM